MKRWWIEAAAGVLLAVALTGCEGGTGLAGSPFSGSGISAPVAIAINGNARTN